ncbi:hypothetical protein OTU49_014840 [Cherax quadricarinatus]|uniref:Uncharacterized protein n=1 Tax=Cherax quadricarinatus TaxID=27406 RepID=A0AAW0YFE8_CHEQU
MASVVKRNRGRVLESVCEIEVACSVERVSEIVKRNRTRKLRDREVEEQSDDIRVQSDPKEEVQTENWREGGRGQGKKGCVEVECVGGVGQGASSGECKSQAGARAPVC